MKKKKIHHIGIAVYDLNKLEEQLKFVMGMPFEEKGISDSGLQYGMIHMGDVELEFMSSNNENTVIGKFLSKKGEGIHHIALEVDNIKNTMEQLEQKEIRLLSKEPVLGIGNLKTCFIHPKDSFHVLVELVEEASIQ